jgi:hypothetical protein
MTSYSLRQISDSHYGILLNRKKVGFVNKCPAGYVGRIGQHCETASTPEAAFRAIAAKALGFKTPADVAAHNAVVRQQRAQTRAAAKVVVDALLRGNYEPFVDALLQAEGRKLPQARG